MHFRIRSFKFLNSFFACVKVPPYIQYEILKKMCDIAFIAGIDGGFGIA